MHAARRTQPVVRASGRAFLQLADAGGVPVPARVAVPLDAPPSSKGCVTPCAFANHVDRPVHLTQPYRASLSRPGWRCRPWLWV